MDKLNLQNYPYLRKHFGNSGEYLQTGHPLESSNLEYLAHVENILRTIDGIPNLAGKIKESKAITNWESVFSEFEFAERLMPLKPEFIKRENKSVVIDLKATLFGEDIFFEVKTLAQTELNSEIHEEISKIPSDLCVTLNGIVTEKEEVGKIVDFLKEKISINETGDFTAGYFGINIEKKIHKYPNQKTLIISSFQTPFNWIKYKISKTFSDNLRQFRSRSPIFWVIDCKKISYSHYGFKVILLNAIEGLFYLEDAKCLNGVIALIHGNVDLFLNPNVKKKLDGNSVAELKDLLFAELY